MALLLLNQDSQSVSVSKSVLIAQNFTEHEFIDDYAPRAGFGLSVLNETFLAGVYSWR